VTLRPCVGLGCNGIVYHHICIQVTEKVSNAKRKKNRNGTKIDMKEGALK